MRKVLLIGGAAALMAVPATVLADDDVERVADPDPTAEGERATTTSALHAEGRGGFRYEGSGATSVEGRGVVRVRDLSSAGDLAVTPSGFQAVTRAAEHRGGKGKGKGTGAGPGARKGAGGWTVYVGSGTLAVDGSSYRVTAVGRFESDVTPSAAHPATGRARVTGRGASILQGGVPVPFRASQRILLSRGPMAVDLSGPGRVGGARARDDHRKGKGRRADGLRRRHHRAHGATWRLNGPAAGTVQIATITGRVRVWDRSSGKDLSATVPAGTRSRTLADGSVVYEGLRRAEVTLAGTAFRMKVRARDVEGVFTPSPGTLARAFVQGKGTFDTADVTDATARARGGVRVLLQPTETPAT